MLDLDFIHSRVSILTTYIKFSTIKYNSDFMKRWEKYRDYLIWGDWHMHTSYTDGQNTVLEMAEQAEKNGLKLIAFTEHVTKEMSYDFDQLIRDIKEARKLHPSMKILVGCEAKILDTEGTLDVPEDVLKKCEIVIASFHTFPYSDKTNLLTAMRNLIRNPEVDIWGHPTKHIHALGITLSSREAESLIEMCRSYNVLVEHSLRYPSTQWFANRALMLGAPVVFNSDAHSVNEIRKLEYR